MIYKAKILMLTILSINCIECQKDFIFNNFSPNSNTNKENSDNSGFVNPLEFKSFLGLNGIVPNLANNAPNEEKYQPIFNIEESKLVPNNDFFANHPTVDAFIPNFYRASESAIQPQVHNENPKKSKFISDDLSIASQFQASEPEDKNLQRNEDHLAPYKKYSFQTQGASVIVPKYQFLTSTYSDPYSSSLNRYKRYSNDKKSDKKDDDDSTYDYLSDYTSRPKEFDESDSYEPPNFGNFGDAEEQKEYDYGSGPEYGLDEYERIKSLSEKQAAEARKDPKNCKEVKKDSMTCNVCQNPKTGGSYESCSYVSEPKTNKYAYVKEQKFDSDDEPEEQDESVKAEIKQTADVKPSDKSQYSFKSETKPQRGFARFQHEADKKIAPNSQSRNSGLRLEATEPQKFIYEHEKNKDVDEDFNYESSFPEFYSDTEQKKNVEHVLAEFAKKDRSACKKVLKNEMTCYQCIDKTGLKHEECMFVSESAPKSSHLAYKEIKEFNSKPDNKNVSSNGNFGAESNLFININPTTAKITPTNAPIELPVTVKNKFTIKKYLPNRGRKSESLISQLNLSTTTPGTVAGGYSKKNIKRNAVNENLQKTSTNNKRSIDDIANPSEFASTDSKGAFWSEMEPKYSEKLGVTLPKYMISKSEHEQSFDEFFYPKK